MVETKKLEKLSARLNQKSDSINETIQKIQDKVNSFNIGLETWLKYGFRSEELPGLGDAQFSTTHEIGLGYAKISDRWCFAVRKKEIFWVRTESGDWDRTGENLIEEPKALLTASREIRIAALGALQILIDDIQKKVEDALSEIENAKKLSDEL